MEKSRLAQLCEKCKCGVYVFINEHRNYYKTAEFTLSELFDRREDPPEIDSVIRAEMIKRDYIVEIHFYPDTPIGFFCVYHWDLDAALCMALELLNNR